MSGILPDGSTPQSAGGDGAGAGSLLDRYQLLLGVRATERLLRKAHRLRHLRVLHVNSTRHGGGVAQILSSLTPLMNDVGIATEWFVMEGSEEFFAFTKNVHNALQGEPLLPSSSSMALHREVANANAGAVQLDDFDVVIVHDPQPLPLIEMRRDQIWIWWCHIDLSAPCVAVWDYVASIVQHYDTAVFSHPDYGQSIAVPQKFVMPAIDAFSRLNHGMERGESEQHLERYGIPWDLPLVVQAGRFDKWKDPKGVVDAFCMATERRAATLVLAGNTAADDPEGPAMFESIRACSNDRIIVIDAEDPLLINALQRRAAVVLQKSLREGFGLTVAEAMWKGRPVIGGNVGGIRHQIQQAHTGFLAGDVGEAAGYIRMLLDDPGLRRTLGRRGKERVRKHFLMTRLLEDWLDLLAAIVSEGCRSFTRKPATMA